MDPGKMRHRITFQAPADEVDALGDPLGDWSEVATVWAAIEPISGREFFAMAQSQSEVTHKVKCRYRSGLQTNMRILFGSRSFKILSIIDYEERHSVLTIMCKELVK